jgi:phosphoglycerol transferase MdoB-like AlkP superfamily enzyme
MTQTANPISIPSRRLKVVYGWYVYTVYALLIFNLYLAVYNICVRQPFEAPLVFIAHSLFIALMLRQILKKRAGFSWLLLIYFMTMRLYYANILHAEFSPASLSLVWVVMTLLLAGTLTVRQFNCTEVQQEWLARFGWCQWAVVIGIAAILTLLFTHDYLG